MKRATILLILLAVTFAVSAQTGLYKRFASMKGVQAYCVERYPLTSGDSVCVTLLQTDDSVVYRKLRRELTNLPYAARSKVKAEVKTSNILPDGMTQQQADSIARHWQERKHLVIFNADGFPGDKGYYKIYCPSDRMTVLAFLVTSDDEDFLIASHMLTTEF